MPAKKAATAKKPAAPKKEAPPEPTPAEKLATWLDEADAFLGEAFEASQDDVTRTQITIARDALDSLKGKL